MRIIYTEYVIIKTWKIIHSILKWKNYTIKLNYLKLEKQNKNNNVLIRNIT
jgi:hypothetical protein